MWQSFPIKFSSSLSLSHCFPFSSTVVTRRAAISSSFSWRSSWWKLRICSDCEVLEDWIRSITNHLYLVPSATLMREKEDFRWDLLSVFWHVQKYVLATATNAVNVSIESWTTMTDTGEGSGQVGTDLLVILMCINIIFCFMFCNFYYLGSKVV